MNNRGEIRSRFTPCLALLVLAGCGTARDQALGMAPCPDHERDVDPVLERRCGDCHGGASPAGGYSVMDRLSTLARQDDGSARLQPGSMSSAFLAAVRGERTGHVPLPEQEVRLLEDWAVRCRAAPRTLAVHPPGWSTPPDVEQFHGASLRSTGYVLDSCRGCHGPDLQGGTSRVSCQDCHPEGPLACNTCHGDSTSPAPPRALNGARATSTLGVGAHRSHTHGCGSCHVLPSSPEAEGHYRRGGLLDPPPAEVVLTGPDARWDRETATCSGTICHAPFPSDARATNLTPQWTKVGEGEAACGTCHGVPPESHDATATDCSRCHLATFAVGQPLTARHVNGVVDIGSGLGSGCGACHGDATSPAPPVDLMGRASESLPSVGAHRAHLEARHRLRGPISCAECHLVPATVQAPGHFDSPAPAEVFPPVPGVGTLASADGATPTYDALTGTCGTVYCHAGGARRVRDRAPGRITNPSWTGGTSQAVCGTCHGIPPADGLHPPVLTLRVCVSCHAPSVTAGGAIRITTDAATGEPTSTHMDGRTTVGLP